MVVNLSTTPTSLQQLVTQISGSASVSQIQELDGTQGLNRDNPDHCQIKARNDFEAIMSWLNEYKHVDQTYRNYQKESERLLLWCMINHKKPLSSLDRDDFEKYIDFLKDPQPREIWCTSKDLGQLKRGDPNWRPFISGLGQSSINTAIAILNSLMDYLVDANYLRSNPLRLIRKRKKWSQKFEVMDFLKEERVIEPELWNEIIDTIHLLPEDNPKDKNEKMRATLLFSLLYFAALRISDLKPEHTWGNFRKIWGLWWFCVIGKGNKPAIIPIHDDLLTTIRQYRLHFEMYPDPQEGETAPILFSWRTGKGLTQRHMNNIIKRITALTADRLKHDFEAVAKLEKISAHWLRHHSSTNQDRIGISEDRIKKILRHDDKTDTKHYIHKDLISLHKEIQQLKLKLT